MGNQTAIQRELPWDENHAERDLYEAVRAAVDEVGFKEVLFRLGNVDRTTLANRLACRDGRTPNAYLLLVLAQMQPSGNLLAHLCTASGFARPERLVEEKPEERLRRLIIAVRKEHGAAGERTIASTLGSGR